MELFAKLHRHLKENNLAYIHSVLREIYKEPEDKHGKTPLHLATKNDSVDTWQLLMSMGTHQKNQKDREGNAPIHYAAQFSNLTAVQCLVAAGADVNVANVDYTPPLHVAAFVGCSEILNFLLDSGADINFTDTKNQVALHHAVSGRHMESLRYLVARRPLLDVRTRNGVTPLEAALQIGNFPAVQLISQNGADIARLYDPDWNRAIKEHFEKNGPIGLHADSMGFLYDDPASIRSVSLGTSSSKKIELWIKKFQDKQPLKLTKSERKKIRDTLVHGQLPNSMREAFWRTCFGTDLVYNQTQFEYFARLKVEVKDALQIDKDINRSLRNHKLFTQRYGEGQCKLYKVLSAYTLCNTQTRYTQGMSTLGAVVLMYFPDEAEAFGALATMFNNYHLTKWYANNLKGLTESFEPFENLVNKKLPRVHAHLDKTLKTEMMVDNYSSLFLTNWILELYFGILPFDLLLKVWDFIFFWGHEIVFAVGVAILQKFEDAIVSAPNSGSVLHVLKGTFDAPYNHEKFLQSVVSLKIVPEDLMSPNAGTNKLSTEQKRGTTF